MRWLPPAIVVLASLAVGWVWVSRDADLALTVDFGAVLSDPESAEAAHWERGRHRVAVGQRLRAAGDTVLLVEGLRWDLKEGAEIMRDAAGTWQIAGSGRVTTATTPVALRAPVGALTAAAATVLAWTTTADATTVQVEEGSVTSATGVTARAGRSLLLLPERTALRAPDPGRDGFGLDAEEPGVAPPDQGWFHGVVVPVDDEPGRTRAWGAVATAGTWRLTLRRAGQPFASVRRARVRLWTALGVESVTVTWIADDGRELGRQTHAATPGWWDLEAQVAGEQVAIGDRLASWSLSVEAPEAEQPPLRVAEVVLTP